MHITRLNVDKPYDCESKKDDCVKNVALGSFIHVLQDSFSKSHVKREPNGNIVRFGNYNEQDTHQHKAADKEPIEMDINHPSVLTESAIELVNLALKDRKFNTSSWKDAKNIILSRLLNLDNEQAIAGDLGLGKSVVIDQGAYGLTGPQSLIDLVKK